MPPVLSSGRLRLANIRHGNPSILCLQRQIRKALTLFLDARRGRWFLWVYYLAAFQVPRWRRVRLALVPSGGASAAPPAIRISFSPSLLAASCIISYGVQEKYHASTLILNPSDASVSLHNLASVSANSTFLPL